MMPRPGHKRPCPNTCDACQVIKTLWDHRNLPLLRLNGRKSWDRKLPKDKAEPSQPRKSDRFVAILSAPQASDFI